MILPSMLTQIQDKPMIMALACDNNSTNSIELDPDSDDKDFYILRPEPNKRNPPHKFTLSQIKKKQYASTRSQPMMLEYILMLN